MKLKQAVTITIPAGTTLTPSKNSKGKPWALLTDFLPDGVLPSRGGVCVHFEDSLVATPAVAAKSAKGKSTVADAGMTLAEAKAEADAMELTGSERKAFFKKHGLI